MTAGKHVSDFTSGLTALTEAGRAYLLPRGAISEDRLVGALAILSAAVHLTVLLTDLKLLSGTPPTLLEESIDVDLVSDLDLTPPPTSVLPNAEKAPEAKVPAQLLPQLTKTYSVKEETRPEETVAEAKAVEPIKTEAPPAPEAKKPEPTLVKTENKEDNPLDQRELLKRAALEKLRKDAKFADKPEAPDKGSLAAVADALNKIQEKKGPTTGSALGKGRAKEYGDRVRKAVHANYTLPEVYNLRNVDIHVIVRIVVAERGDLIKIDIANSSGNATYDAMVLEAVRASAPLPQPPKELVGIAFDLVFSPRAL